MYELNGIQEDLKVLLQLTHKNAPETDLKALYKRLITEEYKELMDEQSRTPEDFKELCDLLWVIIQYANTCGYNLETGLDALAQEYCSKFRTKEGEFEPLYREDGKLLKNTGFKKANFAELMNDVEQQ